MDADRARAEDPPVEPVSSIPRAPRTPTRASNPKGRRWLRTLAIAGAVFAVLLVTTWLGVRRWIRSSVWRGLESMQGVLGREVSAADVTVHLGRTIDVEIDGLRVAARRGSARASPLLSVARIRVVAPWLPSIRSGGRVIEIDSIRVDEPSFELVREASGALSTEDVTRHVQDWVHRNASGSHADVAWHVGRADLAEGNATFVEMQRDGSPRLVQISRITTHVTDVRDRAPIRFGLQLAASARDPNADVAIEISPSRSAAGVSWVVRSADVQLRDVPLDEVLGLDLAHANEVRSGRVGGHVAVRVPAGAPIEADVDLAFRGLAVTDSPTAPALVPSRPMDASIRVEASFEASHGDLTARNLVAIVDGMHIAGEVSIESMRDHPRVRALDLHASDLRLERLVPLLPPRLRPARSRFEGPAEIVATASGSADDAQFDARIDLTGATLSTRDLRKPAGAPLRLEARGHSNGTTVQVERLGVVLGPLHLLGHGAISWPERVDLTFDTGDVALAGLLPFLPSARSELGTNGSLSGTARIEGAWRREARSDDAHASVSLRGARVRLERFELDGEVTVRAEGRTVRGHQTLRLHADATTARVLIPGRFDKRVNAPLRIDLSLDRVSRHVRVVTAAIEAPGLRTQGSGDYDPAHERFAVRLGLCEIDIDRLGSTIDEVAHRAPAAIGGASARFALLVEGDPRALDDAHVRITDLSFRAPYGTARGSLETEGVRVPRRIAFDLDVDTLDLGEIPHTGSVRPGASTRRGELPSWLDTVRVEGRLRAREIRRGDASIANLDARLALANGRFDARTLRFDYDGGALDLTDTQWNVRGNHALVLRARATRLDVAQLAANLPPERRPRGRLSGELSLTGSTDDADPMRAFSGPVRITGEDLEIQRVLTPTVGFNHPLLRRLSLRLEQPGQPAQRPPVHVRRLEARLRIESGALRTTAPLTAETDLGDFDVTGLVTVGGALDLRGSVSIAPTAIWEQSQHRLLPSGPVPVTVHLTGSTEEPHVEITDVTATLRALGGSITRAIGERLRERFQQH